MFIKIYHNPRCSKSREALKFIEDKRYNHEIFLYLDDNLSKADILDILKLLQLKPKDIIRTKEKEYKDLNLKDATDEDLIDAIISYPKLLERPIVVIDNKKAVIARPIEKLMEFI